MDSTPHTYYLIRSDILPEAIQKTLEAKSMLERGEVETIQDAVDQVGLSRSAFYKYRDAIFYFDDMVQQKIITVSLHLEHQAGMLSNMLRLIAANKGNVLTIHQTIPLQGMANVVVSVETAHMDISVSQFTKELEQIDGVHKVIVVGQGS